MILEHAPVLAFSKDRQGRYRMVSRHWRDVFGGRLDEVLGRTDLELFPPDVAARFRAHDLDVLRGGERVQVEEEVSVAGVPRVFRTMRFPLVDADGDVVGVGGHSVDITREQASRRELVDARQRYQASLEVSPQVHVAIDLGRGAFVEANKSAETFFGLPREVIFQHPPWELSPATQPNGGSSEDLARAYLQEAVELGQCAFDWVHRRSDGELMPARVMLVAQHLGEQSLVQASIQDLRGHRARAKAQQREQRFFEQIQSLNRMGGWQLEMPEDQLHWTEMTFRIHGMDPTAGGTLTREDALRGFQPESRDLLLRTIQQAQIDGAPFDLELRLEPEAGQVVLLRMLGAVEFHPGGGCRIYGTVQDIGERRLLEEQLRQAQKLEGLGQLAGGIAHDFNNILTVVMGAAELLEDEVISIQGRSDLDAIRNAAAHARALTSHLLSFARQGEAQPLPLRIDDALEGVASLLIRLLGEDLRLSVEPDAGGAVVRVDRTQLEQVLVNLAVNARDAMPGGGALRIRSARRRRVVGQGSHGPAELAAGSYVTLEVVDQGAGMSSDVLERVFEPFFTTKEVGQGSGLGLSTVHGIVHQWDGAVEVESEPGVGTLVRVWVPEVLDGSAPRLADRSVSDDSGTSMALRVLVVEDDLAVQLVTQRVLERAGFFVLTSPDASHALQLLAGPERVDVMVSDVIMPDTNGLELAERAVALRSGLPVLHVSGYAEAALKARGLDVSSIDLLAKPFRPKDLVARVLALVGERAACRPSG